MTFHPIASLSKRAMRLRSFPILVRRSGGTFMLDPRNWLDNRVAAGLPHEATEIAIATRCILMNGLDTLIDAGANIGLYTVLVGSLAEVTQVFAFEPVRRNFNQMLGNVFANRLDAKVEAFRIGLSDHPGQTTIHVDPNSTGVSRLNLTACGREVRAYTRQETIQLARCDDVLSLTGRRIYLKIDVEGHSINALAGMERLFRDNVVFVQIEADESEIAEVSAILDGYGLRASAATGDDHFFSPNGVLTEQVA